ncbi:MAG: lycopene cyclase domain-containing protein [Anaerolineales bacterium]|nr:lycopene cyclase domain-containing protein [Anaerolineales bacterium]
MSYFTFLAIFLVIPILILLGEAWRNACTEFSRIGRFATLVSFDSYPAAVALLGHILIALLYTTPWDNYLVATRVWWYDPALVTGIVLGWVPIEEYTFFILQPIFTGLWLFFWMRRLPVNERVQWESGKLRITAVSLLGMLWLAMIGILLGGWKPGTYLALQLGWALPPIMLQLAFGADILWKHRRLVFLAIVPTTLYLSGADAIAIQAGTWTIDPSQSLGWLIGGILPFEEFLFFLNTNVLVVFGMTLLLARESQSRLKKLGGTQRVTEKTQRVTEI